MGQRTDRPNVLVFFSDQQRWDTTGVHGNPMGLTPNFDRMAQHGTHVANSFPCQPVCGPARESSESAGLPPWTDGMAILHAYNEVIARCASNRSFVHLVDMRSAFLGHGIHCTQPWRAHYQWDDPHYWYFENLEDPNERGYDAIRRLFLLKMAEVLAPNRAGSRASD